MVSVGVGADRRPTRKSPLTATYLDTFTTRTLHVQVNLCPAAQQELCGTVQHTEARRMYHPGLGGAAPSRGNGVGRQSDLATRATTTGHPRSKKIIDPKCLSQTKIRVKPPCRNSKGEGERRSATATIRSSDAGAERPVPRIGTQEGPGESPARSARVDSSRRARVGRCAERPATTPGFINSLA